MSSVYLTAFLTSQTRQSTTTLANDSVLQFNVIAGRVYAVRAKIFYTTLAVADFKFGLTGIATFDILAGTVKMTAPDGVLSQAIFVTFTSHSITSATNGVGCVEYDFTLSTGSGSGTISFQWAQNTSDASDTTVYKGSYIEYKEMV